MSLICISSKKNYVFKFFQIQSLIQISHKLKWFGLKREDLMFFYLFEDYI